MKIIIQGESIDLPMMLARLSEMAAVSGQSLKGFMESVLEGKAMEGDNPSPSNDPWFDDECNNTTEYPFPPEYPELNKKKRTLSHPLSLS